MIFRIFLFVVIGYGLSTMAFTKDSAKKPLSPNPSKRTDAFQAFQNYKPQKKGTISIKDINKISNINKTQAKGFDSDLANAKFLQKFNNPSAVWDAMYKPTLSVPHSGYNLQDLINELRARGYNLDSLLDECGLRPILHTVTTSPYLTFHFYLNDIFAKPTRIQLEISGDYEFKNIIYSVSPQNFFCTDKPVKLTLKKKILKNGHYFWRIKVLDKDLVNLYSDIGSFEIGHSLKNNIPTKH